LTCLLAGGHLLIEDIPGIGKTTLAQVLSRSMGLQFRRVQFTSDMLPGDILGGSIFDPATAAFAFHPGPIFTQVLLADEINRATPKTQSALLEAMEERQVTSDGKTRRLTAPFFVIATQNPLELSGTFPLPESQLDRFLMRIATEYPLGLFRAWARIDTGLQGVVYPVPVAAPMPGSGTPAAGGNGQNAAMAGVDDFQGLSAYQPGDSPRCIHWQAYSRGRGLYTKAFAGEAGSRLMLDLATIDAPDIEEKLSILCFHVLRAHRRRQRFGLRLPGRTIPSGSGRPHRDRCLRALALTDLRSIPG
jgi:hypothetical protein